MPWNLPLWWQLRRLRYAIEVDCDARVLAGGLDPAHYGETLIAVGERQSAYVGAVAAMSESRSFLEERIRIMISKPVKWRRARRRHARRRFTRPHRARRAGQPAQRAHRRRGRDAGWRGQARRTCRHQTTGRHAGPVRRQLQAQRAGVHRYSPEGGTHVAHHRPAGVEIFPETETNFFWKRSTRSCHSPSTAPARRRCTSGARTCR